MTITIHSTTKIVTLSDGRGYEIQARVWEGVTPSGVPVHCFVTRIAPAIPKDDERQAEFIEQLRECAAPTADVRAYPARMIL